MSRLAALGLLLCMQLPMAFAVDDILQMKERYEANEPIVIGCSCDTGPDTEVTVFWDFDKGSKTIPTENNMKLYNWAGEGEHWVDALVVSEKFRKLTVLIPDATAPTDLSKAKTETIKLSLGRQIFRQKKIYSVGPAVPVPVPVPPGPTPNPTPVPPPTPAGARDIAIFRESRTQTPEFAATIRQLRDSQNPQAKYLNDNKHLLFVLDADPSAGDANNVKLWRAAAKDVLVPSIVVIDQKTGTVIGKSRLLPTDGPDEIIQIVKGFGG